MTAQRRFDARDLARIAIFAALIVVLGTVSVPLAGGVPITGQTLGVMLAGTVLGARRAPWAILLVLGLAAAGLPVLAGGRGGLGVFVGPTVGYMIGWIVGVVVIGVIAHSGLARQDGRPVWWRVALGAVVGGIAVVYLVGVPVQAMLLGTPLGATALSSLVFLPGDLLKAALATALTLALARAYPPAFARSAAPAEAR